LPRLYVHQATLLRDGNSKLWNYRLALVRAWGVEPRNRGLEDVAAAAA
jgi:hypothetical protein